MAGQGVIHQVLRSSVCPEMAPYLLAVASVSLEARTPGLTRHWPGSGTDREADSPGSTSPWGAVFLIDGSTPLVWDLQDPRELARGAAVRGLHVV